MSGSRLLLDTHVWLWMLTDSRRLPDSVREEMASAGTELYLSVASTWEIGIKSSLGKLALPDEPSVFVPARVRMTGVSLIDIAMVHALRASALPAHHADPFDRLIVAQALTEALTLVTADRKLTRYGAPCRLVA